MRAYFGISSRFVKVSTILWMSCARQAVLGPVLYEARAGVDHENALTRMGVLFVDDDDAGGDASAVKQVGGQTDDALDVTLAHKGAADVALRVATKQYAVRQDARAFSDTLQRRERATRAAE